MPSPDIIIMPRFDLSMIPPPRPMVRQYAMYIDDGDFKTSDERPDLLRRNVVIGEPSLLTRQNARIFTIEEIENINRNSHERATLLEDEKEEEDDEITYHRNIIIDNEDEKEMDLD